MILQEPFLRDYAATVHSESSHNKDESEGIGRVIRNRALFKGVQFGAANFWKSVDGIYGRDSQRYRNANNILLEDWINDSAPNWNRFLQIDLEATARALVKDSDITKGSYFWEGVARLKRADNYFRERLNMKPPIFKIVLTLGGTTFMIYNPAHPTLGNRKWP